MAKQDVKLEEAFDEIDEIIATLEQQDIPLEESFKLFEEGMKKLKKCNDKIEQVEKKLLIMNEKGELEEF